ncbi:MAG: GIY-YIG nuclease family protein [Gammaproteobacteria bacterium]
MGTNPVLAQLPEITRDAGTYVLEVFLSTSEQIRVGKIGVKGFQAGYYYYVGSAFGPGGLRARIRHHAGHSRRKHWHIDYLSELAELQSVFFVADTQRFEHEWAQRLMSLALLNIPVKGFGATDCHCLSHLFYSAETVDLAQILRRPDE